MHWTDCTFDSRKRSYTSPVILLVMSLIVFEIWHAFSHMRHIIHAITYIIASMTLLVIYETTGSVHLGFVACAVVLDIAILVSNHTQLSVLSGVFVFVAVVIGNIDAFPQEYLPILFALIILGAVVFLLEHRFCDAAMNVAALPYHAIVEIIVMLFILTFANMILQK